MDRRKFRMCDRKKGYRNKEQARQARMRLWGYGIDVSKKHVYPCPYCGQYHVGESKDVAPVAPEIGL